MSKLEEENDEVVREVGIGYCYYIRRECSHMFMIFTDPSLFVKEFASETLCFPISTSFCCS